ncbi:MAG: DUF2796 domain-containing protein [Azoarcus sp.]|nr:DUF2796 domain-containing protein [Azoarcus sp.]
MNFNQPLEKVKMKKFLIFCMAVGGALVLGDPVSAHDAHEHGVAHLNLVVDEQEVEIELETPLANVLSFEHAPQTDAQKKEVRDMAALMRKADALFVFPAQARCELAEVSLDSDAVDREMLASGSEGAQEHEHDEDANEARGHGDLDVEVSFLCRDPGKLNSVTVDVFKVFPDMRRMDVQMFTPKGQKAAKLTPESNVIQW